MKYIGNRSVGEDLPNGFYLEYAIFDDGKNIWITNKDGNKDELFLSISGIIYPVNKYDSNGVVIEVKSREYQELLVEKYNPPKCLSFVLDSDCEEEEATCRVLYSLDDDEVSIHVFTDLL